jgi:hypothetical protein
MGRFNGAKWIRPRRGMIWGLGAMAVVSGSIMTTQALHFRSQPPSPVHPALVGSVEGLGQLAAPGGPPVGEFQFDPARSQETSLGGDGQPSTGTKDVAKAAPDDATVKLKSGVGVTQSGLLRISNPTAYAVRIALLPQKPGTATTYEPPAHWDFDPEEGQVTGLLVGLPQRPNLQVQPGDVLVAFALDGSRRYWGPYVVGETEFPNWESKGGEWRLILQP